jgi:hypothetical protein
VVHLSGGSVGRNNPEQSHAAACLLVTFRGALSRIQDDFPSAGVLTCAIDMARAYLWVLHKVSVSVTFIW